MSEKEREVDLAISTFIESTTIAFTMMCDQNNLTVDQGLDVAEALALEIESAADDRRDYA